MKLYVDARETSLVPLLTRCETKPLTLGDVVIADDEGNELTIIERKTVADLAASIKDGRYKEQSERLLAYNIPPHNVVYLIEGTLRATKLPLPCETLMASMVSLLFGKGFSVVRTESLEQTAQFINVLLTKLEKEKGYALNVRKEDASERKMEKKDRLNPANINAFMLSQIPYVNMQTAKAILSVYPSVSDLTTALKTNANCLDEVRFIKDDKARKISSKSIDSIKYFLNV